MECSSLIFISSLRGLGPLQQRYVQSSCPTTGVGGLDPVAYEIDPNLCSAGVEEHELGLCNRADAALSDHSHPHGASVDSWWRLRLAPYSMLTAFWSKLKEILGKCLEMCRTSSQQEHPGGAELPSAVPALD